MPSRSKVEWVEQEFVLTPQSTFASLLKEATAFWGPEVCEEDFQLFGHKFENLMCLNADPKHPAHRVSAYFELLRTRYPLLYLLRTENHDSNTTIQKSATLIKTSIVTAVNNKRLYDLKSQVEKKNALHRENFNKFLTKYPGQKPFDISELKDKTKVDESIDPDTYFQTLLVNVLLLIVTLLPILFMNDYNERYWMQKSIKSLFDASDA